MDFVRAIMYPFDDDEWPVKVIIGVLLSLVPFFGPGYQVRVARNVLRGEPRPLPDSDELGQVFMDGVYAVIAGLIYFAPLILLACLLLFPGLIAGDGDTSFLLLCAGGTCLFVIGLAYTIPALGLYVMGIIRYAETGSFSSFIQFGALWRDSMANLGLLVMLWLYSLGLILIGVLVSPLAAVTVVGAPLLGFWHQVASGYLIGQAGLEVLRSE